MGTACAYNGKMAHNTGDFAIDSIHHALDALERSSRYEGSSSNQTCGVDEEAARLSATLKIQASIRGRNVRRPSPSTASTGRLLSMAKSVAAAGGSEAWNTSLPETQALWGMLDQTCKAHSTEEALADLRGIMSLGHNIWAYSYMRVLYKHNIDVFFGCLMAEPAMLMPVVYTPTVATSSQCSKTTPSLTSARMLTALTPATALCSQMAVVSSASETSARGVWESLLASSTSTPHVPVSTLTGPCPSSSTPASTTRTATPLKSTSATTHVTPG